MTNGIYSTGLGAVSAFPDSLWQNAQLWLGIRPAAGAELPQRIRIVAVPYALRAKVAERVDGGGGAGDLPAGTMVISTRADDAALLGAGYIQARRVFWENWNAWTPIATANAPSASADHTAVWTGLRMIVWGHDRSRRPVGGLYDPGADGFSYA